MGAPVSSPFQRAVSQRFTGIRTAPQQSRKSILRLTAVKRATTPPNQKTSGYWCFAPGRVLLQHSAVDHAADAPQRPVVRALAILALFTVVGLPSKP